MNMPAASNSPISPTDASLLTIAELLRSGRPSSTETGTENARLNVDMQRMADRQREIMELLNCKSPERIIHDLRNLINELNLYRTLVDATE